MHMTFAVIKTGGKQYKVAANDVLKIEKLDAQAGDIVTFDQVLMVGDEIGAPLVEGALVAAELVSTDKQKTVIVFKKNRRHNYRRRNGHRQLLSTVRITEILTGGAQPSRQAAAANATTDTVVDTPAPQAASAEQSAPAAQQPETVAEASAKPKRAATKKAAADADTDAAAEKPAKKPAAKKAPKADQE
jgi:large subunit ribosomal protein L21